MKVLITGGAGFIGSTIASALLDSNHVPVVLDNLITGRREFVEGRIFYEGSVSDKDLISRIFAEHPDISAVVHCAALIVVPESVAQPARYYEANVVETLRMVEALLEVGCERLIFSSSASIYVPGTDFSVNEDSPVAPLSPYARTKVVIEDMLREIAAATPLRVISLRYFNPVGADPEFRSGLQVREPTHALGKLVELTKQGLPFAITGDDYPTRDGSGIRDYVHVWDLAAAHIAALERFDDALENETYTVINLGTGRGTTAVELVDTFASVIGRPVSTVVAPRRPGDAAGAFTKSDKAERILGWKAEHSLAEGIADTLHWFEVRSERLPDLA
jgi:UDP-glucose 4-epimerase